MTAAFRIAALIVIAAALVAIGVALVKDEYQTATWAGVAAVWAAYAIVLTKEEKR